jgi:hypothetical protein
MSGNASQIAAGVEFAATDGFSALFSSSNFSCPLFALSTQPSRADSSQETFYYEFLYALVVWKDLDSVNPRIQTPSFII